MKSHYTVPRHALKKAWKLTLERNAKEGFRGVCVRSVNGVSGAIVGHSVRQRFQPRFRASVIRFDGVTFGLQWYFTH